MSAFQVIPFITFMAVAHPSTYKATRGVLGSWVASADGLASIKGLTLHAIVFVLLTVFMMRFIVPRISGYVAMGGSCKSNMDCMAPATCKNGKCMS